MAALCPTEEHLPTMVARLPDDDPAEAAGTETIVLSKRFFERWRPVVVSSAIVPWHYHDAECPIKPDLSPTPQCAPQYPSAPPNTRLLEGQQVLLDDLKKRCLLGFPPRVRVPGRGLCACRCLHKRIVGKRLTQVAWQADLTVTSSISAPGERPSWRANSAQRLSERLAPGIDMALIAPSRRGRAASR
jgi:hypothetical protein